MPITDSLKLVAIGGGTGLSTLLRGLKGHLAGAPKIELTAIVTVTDDGNSSGRLRQEFDVLPPGDIRNCLVALAAEDQLLTKLFGHRFSGDGSIGGHSLGNLILLALTQMNGDFMAAIEMASRMLKLKARVLPSTLDRADLVARLNGKTIKGQMAIKMAIKSQPMPIRELSLDPPDARALPAAVQAIHEADLITLGPGSLYTSVIANLLVKGIADALASSAARKLYICNAMTEFDETNDFTAEDHVRQLLTYAPGMKLDYALFNSEPISAEMLDRYAAERAYPIRLPNVEQTSVCSDGKQTSVCSTLSSFQGVAYDVNNSPEFGGIQFIAMPLASESRAVRHDPEKLSRAILDVYSR